MDRLIDGHNEAPSDKWKDVQIEDRQRNRQSDRPKDRQMDY